MVAVSIFVIVAVVATGALITISDVNRKAQAIKIAMDNVAFAMDSMVTNLREGSRFGCLIGSVLPNNPVGVATGHLNAAANAGTYLGDECTSDGQGLIFKSERIGTAANYIIYRFFENSDGQGSIQKASTDSPQYVDMTSSEVGIDSLRFYVPDAESTGEVPRVTIVIRG